MFKLVKEKVSIVDVLSKEMGQDFKPIGSHNFAPADETCPFCGHKDCFRIKDSGEGDETPFYKCFSCDETGDVINFISKAREITSREAALALAKEWNISLPLNYNPIQDMFNMAAVYYSTCFNSTCDKPYSELNKLTPKEYQTTHRRHTEEVLNLLQVGWSDGGLCNYLGAFGFDSELLESSGLVNKKGQDFLPAKSFIYPHFIKGQVSHFTFKDPLKQKAYQLKNINKLNDYSFYNSDSISKGDTVIVVEGENDLISIVEAGWAQGVIACIGSISGAQLEWMEKSLAGKNVITIFDNDQAGDKYREKVGRLRSKFGSLLQVKTTNGVKDVDEFLKAGGNLQALIVNNTVQADYNSQDTGVEVESDSAVEIVEKGNCYHRIKYKEGEPYTYVISNFVMNLKHILSMDDTMTRVVTVTREDGRTTNLVISSEQKISLKAFKTVMADKIDAAFYGSEVDLAAMWNHIYAKGNDKQVILPSIVGRVDKLGGWLFRENFVSDNGDVILPDDEGILWNREKSAGIKAWSQDQFAFNRHYQENMDIPKIMTNMTEDQREEHEETYIRMMVKNLGGDIGLALTMIGWIKSNVHSDLLFRKINGFPFLFIWGLRGSGKSVMAKWLASTLGMHNCGYGTWPQYKTGAGFGRKLAYYASLPMIVDEMRSDGDVQDSYGTVRSWFNRAGRNLAARDNVKQTREEVVRANFMFVGQDLFTDNASRQRAVTVRIQSEGREKAETYVWFEEHIDEHSILGYHWILESHKIIPRVLLEEFDFIDKTLVRAGCDSRVAKCWAGLGIFMKRFSEKYFPEFDIMKYMSELAMEGGEEDAKDDLAGNFFGILEELQVAENSPITGEHIKVKDGMIYLWFDALYRMARNSTRGSMEEKFSNRAVRKAIKEDLSYFRGDRVQTKMGSYEGERRTIRLDIQNAPQSVKNLARIANS